MPQTILVIEDDDVMRELMQLSLVRSGYEVTVAEDGVRGYDTALFLRPDLIVTDIQMPKLDGIEMIKRLRDRLGSENVPILVMSSFGNGAIQAAMDAGANKSTPKPMAVDYFLKIVRQLLD